MHRIVNGKRIEITEQEESAIQAEWSDNVTKQATIQEIADLKALLKATDWYVIRKMENQTEIPNLISQRRTAARQRLSQLNESL